MANFEDKMCRAAAHSLIASLDSLQSIHFKANNLPDKLIAILAELNLPQQKWLIHRAGRYLTLQLDPLALERQIKELEDKKEVHELENTYLLLGAPRTLMRRLFGMHASEFTRRREILNLKGISMGRPPQCDEAMEHKVWMLWQSHEELDIRHRLITIAEEANLDLHMVWGALREHIDT